MAIGSRGARVLSNARRSPVVNDGCCTLHPCARSRDARRRRDGRRWIARCTRWRSVTTNDMDDALNPTLRRLLRLCRLDRRFVRGEGVWLFDDGGRRYLDASGQYGALVLGHNPPVAVEALRA